MNPRSEDSPREMILLVAQKDVQLREYLEAQRYHVFVADSAETAFQVGRDLHFDAVITNGSPHCAVGEVDFLQSLHDIDWYQGVPFIDYPEGASAQLLEEIGAALRSHSPQRILA